MSRFVRTNVERGQNVGSKVVGEDGEVFECLLVYTLDVLDDVDALGTQVTREEGEGCDLVGWSVASVVDDDVEWMTDLTHHIL